VPLRAFTSTGADTGAGRKLRESGVSTAKIEMFRKIAQNL